jgi:proline iminopeptidase
MNAPTSTFSVVPQRTANPPNSGISGLHLFVPLMIITLLGGLSVAFSQGLPITGTLHATDVDLAFEAYGQPTAEIPIIAVNGGPGLSHKYMIQNNVWQKLAEKRQIVFYDQRGTGKSMPIQPGASQAMDAQVADLEAVRAHFGFQKIDIVGDSYGGFLAMAYATAHPERVHKLILSDSAPPAFKDIVHLLPEVFPDIEEEDAEIQKKMGDTDEAAQKQLLNHFRMIFYDEDKLHTYLANIGDIGYVPRVGAAVEESASKIDMTQELPKFKFPTLIITGRYDLNVAPLTAWRMYKSIPGAKLAIFAKSGHLPSYEEPDKYVEGVNAFLAGK